MFKWFQVSSSSSLCHAISMDISDSLAPPTFSIVHCFRQVFRATSRIGEELLYIGSSWSSCLCPSMWRGLQEYITFEFQLYKWLNSSIWPIDGSLTGTTNPSQSEHGSNCTEEVINVIQNSRHEPQHHIASYDIQETR